MAPENRLQSVLQDAALTLDERYEGYRADVARALTLAIRAQSDSPSDAARAREIDRIIESLGQKLQRR